MRRPQAPGQGQEEIYFPNKARTIRLSRGLSLTKVAQDLKISLSALSKIEKGYRRINDDLMVRLSKMYGVSPQDFFIKAGDKEADLWRDLMQKRVQKNSDLGLKIFGAALRYFRKQKRIVLRDMADKIPMTTSVYHRLETGRREIYPDELERIAKILGFDTKEIFIKAREALNKGDLERYIKKTDVKMKAILSPHSVGSNASATPIYGAHIYESSRRNLIPVFGIVDAKGAIRFKKSEDSMMVSPLWVKDHPTLYAVEVHEEHTKKMFARGTYFLVEPAQVAKPGDLVVVLPEPFDKLDPDKEYIVQLGSLRSHKKGEISVALLNVSKQVHITQSHRVHRVVFVVVP